MTMSHKRFIVLGGPGGYLTCRPAGCPMTADRYKGWQPLFKVNRRMTTALASEAKVAALRHWEIA